MTLLSLNIGKQFDFVSSFFNNNYDIYIFLLYNKIIGYSKISQLMIADYSADWTFTNLRYTLIEQSTTPLTLSGVCAYT